MTEIIYYKGVKRFVFSLMILMILSITLFISSLFIGSSSIDLYKTVHMLSDIFLNKNSSYNDPMMNILDLRISRGIAAYFTGFALGLAGLLIQTVTRNPLADPYILGLSTSSLAFVSLSILLSPDIMIFRWNLVLIAFLGALSGFFITIGLSKLAGGSSVAIVLSGIAVGSFFGGVSHLLLYLVQARYNIYVMYLLTGTVQTVLWRELPYLIYPSIVGVIISLLIYKMLNAYLYGDVYSRQLGFPPGFTRTISLVITSLLTAVTISIVGIIGFIGLASPHITRFLVGNDHRFTIVLSPLVGGVLTLFSDISVRIISYAYGAELPLGVITMMIGSPFLAFLIIKRLRE